MKNMKKMMALALCGVVLFGGTPVGVKAAEADNVENVQSETDTASKGGLLRKDNIITKYRVHNGKLQYRRWNTTYGVWVDPYWIDLS